MQSERIIVYHGTAAVHEDAILRDGLREPFGHRGVAFVREAHLALARDAAQAACAVQRHAERGRYVAAEGLIVCVDVWDLVGIDAPADLLDAPPVVYVVEQVPPDRILSVERIPVTLPPRPSLDDWMLRTGMACRRDDGLGRRSIELLAARWDLMPGPLR